MTDSSAFTGKHGHGRRSRIWTIRLIYLAPALMFGTLAVYFHRGLVPGRDSPKIPSAPGALTQVSERASMRVVRVLRPLILVAAMATNTATAQEPPQGVPLHEAPRSLPELTFQDGDGTTMSLTDFHGKVVLLNIWVTWCGPCKREMPTLDRLQAQMGGPAFEVVALSIDRAGLDVVRKFYDEVGIKHLRTYIDSSGKSAQLLGISGLPTTLLIDRDGREAGRLFGSAEWDTPEMIEFLRSRVVDTTGLLGPASRVPILAGLENRRPDTRTAATVLIFQQPETRYR